MSSRSEALPFDLRALDIFIAVCEAGSMAAAARALGLTQPAVSQAIADLEERTGTMLFDRRVRPIGLTPAGGVMRQRAAALLTEARQIAPMLRETERGRFALLRVGLVDSLARALTTTIAIFLKDRAEQVQVRSANFALYGDMSARIVTILRDMFPRVEVYSIDENFVDVEGLRDPVATCLEARERILQWVGIPCCVGLGTTRTLAKAGNKLAKVQSRRAVMAGRIP